MACGIMPLWSCCLALASDARLRWSLFYSWRPWRTADLVRGGRSSILNKLAGCPDLTATAGFPASSGFHGASTDKVELQFCVRIWGGVPSIRSSCRRIVCRWCTSSSSSTTAALGVHLSAQPWYSQAEGRQVGVPAVVDCRSFRRRLIFFLQAVVPLRRQCISSRASASSSSGWWQRRDECIGPSGLVPGSGVLGSLLMMQDLRRRTILQFHISFWGPSCKDSGSGCNFYFLWCPYAHCTFKIININT